MDRLRTPSLPLPINPSSFLLHALLPIFLVLTAFGPGYQTISSFTIIYFPLSVYYIRTCTRWWWIFLFYIMNSIGFMLAFMNTLNIDGAKGFKGIIFGIGLIVNLVILIPYAFDRIAQSKFSSNGWARILIFPCVWTGLSTILLFLSPLGDWGNYAFVLLNYEEITQFASFAGLGGINFILTLSGPVGSDIISYHVTKNQDSSTATSSTGSIVIDNSSSIEDNGSDTVLNHPPARPSRKSLTLPTFINSLSIYIFVLFLVITYGSIRLNNSFIPFYQKSIEEAFPQEVVNLGCVLGNSDEIYDYMSYVNLTQKLAISGNKIILWSEAATGILNTGDLNSLIDSIKNISVTYNAYVGFTYADAISPNTGIYNKQVVINNKGDVVIDYKKSNLVPLVESGFVIKGNNKLQTFQSEDFGIIGSAICFDFDFPKLIGQAPSKKVNLMLDSSNTWGPVGPIHARMNSLRSIENGFTTLRCNSDGISGIWNQYGQPLHYVPTTLSTSTTTFQVPINIIKNRVNTVYSVFGETFGWICVGGIGLFSIVIVVATIGNDQWKARIIRWS